MRGRADGQLERLDTLLGTLIDGLPQLSDLISRSYFAQVPVATPAHGPAGRDDLRGQPPHRLPLQPAGLDLASPAAPDARDGGQACRDTAVEITPAPTVRPGIDYFGNPTTFVTIQQNHVELVLHALSSIEVNDRPIPAAAAPRLGGGALAGS